MSESAADRDELRAAGVADDDATPATLLALADRTPALAGAIVARLATVVDESHAAALRDLAAEAERRGWKRVVKDARRALYRFGQRGVALAESPAPPAPPPRWTATPLEGWVSGVDGRGDRLVWIAKPQAGGGLQVMTAILNEPKGLRDVNLAELPRKSLRRMHDDLRTRHHVQMVAIDGAYCDALLAEGYERSRAGGVAEAVGHYPTLRARLTTHPPAPLDPPMIGRVAPDAAEDAAAVADGAKLLDELDFATWLLDRDTLAPHLDAIRAARESPIVLSAPQQAERVREALEHAERSLFGGASAATYRRRLEEMAYVLHASGRAALARSAAATAARLASAGGPLPFFTELLRRSVGAFVVEDEAKARAEAEGSVLIRPGNPRGGPPPRPRQR